MCKRARSLQLYFRARSNRLVTFAPCPTGTFCGVSPCSRSQRLFWAAPNLRPAPPCPAQEPRVHPGPGQGSGVTDPRTPSAEVWPLREVAAEHQAACGTGSVSASGCEIGGK